MSAAPGNKPNGDSLTVLHSINRRHATKRFTRNPKTGEIKNRSYGNEHHFRAESIAVDNFPELCAALTWLTNQPFAFVIRGEPVPGANLAYTRRLLHGDKKNNDPATFTAASRHWFAIDLDHLPAAALTDPVTDPEGAIEYLISLLPGELADASCWWQFTSSQSLPGHEDTLSARLWYWSSAPLSDADLVRWVVTANRSTRLVDASLYRAVQAHYVATPIFINLADPLPRRYGVRQGLEDEVSLIIPPPDPKNPEVVSGDGYEPGRGVQAWLAEIGGPLGFRDPIKSAIASYIATHGSRADCEPLKAAIRAAIDRADPGGRDAATLERYKGDEHLDDLIRWTRERHGEQPPKGDLGEEPPELIDPDIPVEDPVVDPVPTTYTELIATFNERYAVVSEAGRAMVYERAIDPVRQRQVLTRIKFEDFSKFYMNRLLTVKIDDEDVTRSLAEWWLTSPRRRQYLGGVVFDPTGGAPASYWNLWSGFAVVPTPGDWSLMQDHVRQVICGGDDSLASYLLNFVSRMFQEPNKPGEVAMVLRGAKGAGKGIFLNWLSRAWGQHGIHISNAKHLIGNFNAHLRDCVALFADEAFFAGDRQHEGILKALITEPTIPIEAKYQNTIEVVNMLHLFMSSNSDWVVPASADERRYVVIDVADNRLGDRSYFAAIARQMEEGGLAAMIHDMLGRDLNGFEVRDVPQTEALKIQKTLSLVGVERWWLTVLARGFVWKSRHGAPWFRTWHEFYSTELLHRSYLQWCDENRPFNRQSREQLGAFFARVYQPSRPRGEHPVYEIDSIDRGAKDAIAGPSGAVTMVSKPLDEIAIVQKDRPNGYQIGALAEARVRFTEICDVVTGWGLDPDE